MLHIAAEAVSLGRFKQILNNLSAPKALSQLATDVSFLKQQTGLIHSIAGHVHQACSNEQACKQLLIKVPQLLRQLVVITTAVLQQLTAQRDRELEVSRAAAMLAASVAELLPVAKGWPAKRYDPSAPADTATLHMMHNTGGLASFLCNCDWNAHPVGNKYLTWEVGVFWASITPVTAAAPQHRPRQ
jgi:hypothetical protein